MSTAAGAGVDKKFLDQLNSRIKDQAAEQGTDINAARSRYFRHRFFARLSQTYPGRWVLSGATALEIRADITRSTQDLDTITVMEADELLESIEKMGDSPDDPFEYTFSTKGDLRAVAGAQGKVTVTQGGVRVAAFKMDIEFTEDRGVGPEKAVLDPAYRTDTAADTSADVLLQSTADHVAAKVSGVSRLVERTDRDGNTHVVNQHRYHDLADLALMAEHESVSMADLVQAFEYQERKWGPGAVPDSMGLPGDDWTPENWERARQRRQWPKELTLDQALETSRQMLGPALESYRSGTPASGTWKAGSGWTSEVYVRAYTRADGTEVPEHYRSAPRR